MRITKLHTQFKFQRNSWRQWLMLALCLLAALSLVGGQVSAESFRALSGKFGITESSRVGKLIKRIAPSAKLSPVEVAPSASTTFTVTMTAAAAGAPNGNLSFDNNDSDASTFNFNISGTVEGVPGVAVSETGVGNIPNNGNFSFGTTTVGTPVTKTFTVTNTGTANLDFSGITITGGGGDFSFGGGGGPATIAPNGMITFGIIMGQTAVAAATPSGQISFETNDPGNTLFTINISGTINAAPSVYYVDDTLVITNDVAPPGLSAGDTVTFANGEPGQTTGLIFGTTAFDTIAGALAAAASGNTINVASGTYNTPQVLIDKSLTINGAGATTTFINGGNTPIVDAGLVRINLPETDTGNVSFSGFTITNPGVTGSARYHMFAKPISPLSTITISNNKFTGVNSSDYGLYSDRPRGTVVFDHNELTNLAFNPILIERPQGATDIHHNTFSGHGSTAIFSFTYSGNDVTAKQRVADNTISNSAAAAISINGASPIGGGNGKYTDVEITNNVITQLGTSRNGINLSNGASSGNEALGAIENPVITGNTITGTDLASSKGIRLLGLITNPTIKGNNIRDVERAISGEVTNGHSATGIQANFNSLVSNVSGIYWDGAAPLNAENNWWGCNFGPGTGGTGCSGTPNGLGGTGSANVDANPWLVLGLSASLNSIPLGGTSNLTADLTFNSDAADTSGSGNLPDGTAVTFAGTGGTVLPTNATTTAGKATSVFTATATGPGSASTTVDGQTISTPVTVTLLPTTTTITNAGALMSTPTVVGQSYAVNVTVAATPPGMGTPSGTVNVSDGTGASCMITLSGGSGACNLTSTTAGAKTISASYLGDTNFDISSTMTSHTVNKANTTLSSLTDSPDPSVVGQPYTVGFSLNVTAPGAGTPTGTVTVDDGAGGTCMATLPMTSCQLTSTVAGNKSVTFTYNGDDNFNTSSNMAGHAVNKANTTVAITNDTPDPSVIGQNYAVSANVSVTSPGGGTPTGTITVTDGTNNCTITLPATACNLPSISVGDKTLTATYNGDSNYNGSGPSAGVTHTVNKADVLVTITSHNPDSSAVGQNVTVAFTVAAVSPGAGTPTGNVTITASGGSETCTGSLAAGSGSCTLVLTVPGSRTLTATYNSDANFNGGTDTKTHTVVAPPVIAKTFNPTTAPVNGVSTLTITITNPAANTVALTGVGFTDNFPAGLVVATPLNLNNGCGGTLTDQGSGGLAAGDVGIRLTGGTVGTSGPRTCTVTVNVTPTAQGPLVNTINNVSSTNGGTSSTGATATLLTNSPPTITSDNVPVSAGSSAASFTIATAADPDQAVNTLGITINGNPATASSNGVTVSNLAIQANGSVTANIATTCAATTASFDLVVTDDQTTTGNGMLTLTVTPNTPPVLSYAPVTVVAGTTPVIIPAAGPSDNGTFTIGSVGVSPNNGGLGVLLNQSNGVVSILSALKIGTYTVTVPVTDNCGATTVAQLVVTVVCPTITTNPASLPNATVNTAYPQTLSASPAGGNYSFAVTSGLLPTGLTLNSNGSFSGAPTQSGTFNFRVTASGFGGCSAFRDYVLLVNCPVITLGPATLPGGTLGSAYNQSVSASPAGTYSYTVTSGALPTGVTLNAATGALTGSLTASGTFNFTITATAGTCTASQSYAVTVVCTPPTLSPTTLPTGQAGVAYNQTITANPAGTYTYSLVVGNLPPGLLLNASTGQLSGTATATGTYNFTVQAQTASGCNATQSYSLAINCPTITVNPTTLPTGTTGTAYNQSLSATPAGNYSFAKTSGTLPPGLTLNSSTGGLNGTPTTGGSYTFTVTASGFGVCSGSRSYTVTINSSCTTINLPSLPATGTVNVNYTGNLAATTPSASYTFSLESGTLPPGLVIDNLFGLLRGKPTANGSYTFTLKATRSNGCTGTRQYTVTIGGGSIVLRRNDFDGDGKSDLVLRLAGRSEWRLTLSGTGETQTVSFGAPTDWPILGDYDGDGRTDLAVFRAADQTWLVRSSRTSESVEHSFSSEASTAALIPVAADFDGDGRTDLAAWESATATWFVQRSTDGKQLRLDFGTAGDVPVPADYDGDGRADLAVFQRDGARWRIQQSSDGALVEHTFGSPKDEPLAADFNGDGRAELAVWRPAESALYVQTERAAGLRYAVGLNSPADWMLLGDYDGDGQTEIAVWRAVEGRWFVNLSR